MALRFFPPVFGRPHQGRKGEHRDSEHMSCLEFVLSGSQREFSFDRGLDLLRPGKLVRRWVVNEPFEAIGKSVVGCILPVMDSTEISLLMGASILVSPVVLTGVKTTTTSWAPGARSHVC